MPALNLILKTADDTKEGVVDTAKEMGRLKLPKPEDQICCASFFRRGCSGMFFSQFGLSFVQIGSHDEARKYPEELDDDLAAEGIRDMTPSASTSLRPRAAHNDLFEWRQSMCGHKGWACHGASSARHYCRTKCLIWWENLNWFIFSDVTASGLFPQNSEEMTAEVTQSYLWLAVHCLARHLHI